MFRALGSLQFSLEHSTGIDIVRRKLMFAALWTVISGNTDKQLSSGQVLGKLIALSTGQWIALFTF